MLPLSTPKRRWPALILAVLVLAAAVVGVVSATNRSAKDQPAVVERVPHTADTARQARNLAAWIRAHAR